MDESEKYCKMMMIIMIIIIIIMMMMIMIIIIIIIIIIKHPFTLLAGKWMRVKSIVR